MEKDQSDFERELEEGRQRLFNPKTYSKQRKTIAHHAARPGLTDSLEEIYKHFLFRLTHMQKMPPDTPKEYCETFEPMVRRNTQVPLRHKLGKMNYDLWTQHFVHFNFSYSPEFLRAILWHTLFLRIAPDPEVFFAALQEGFKEMARNDIKQQIADGVESDVSKCVELAFQSFVEALRGRLGTIVTDTCDELAITVIEKLSAQLLLGPGMDIAKMREMRLREVEEVEKARLNTPSPGAPTFQSKEEVEALIDEAKEKLKPARLENNKTVIVKYINEHYPSVRCSSTKQLNRLLDKFKLHHKFKHSQAEEDKAGQK
jgi:hypothetical protein